jgi:preprotein translocase subunit SecE
MARIRPARTGGAPGGQGGPAPTPEPAAAGAGRGRGGGRRSRPTTAAPPPKTGTVTKAVQVGRRARFLNEVATELRKVTWPTRTQLFQATAVVIVFVAIITTYLAVLDELFGRLVDAIF